MLHLCISLQTGIDAGAKVTGFETGGQIISFAKILPTYRSKEASDLKALSATGAEQCAEISEASGWMTALREDSYPPRGVAVVSPDV